MFTLFVAATLTVATALKAAAAGAAVGVASGAIKAKIANKYGK